MVWTVREPLIRLSTAEEHVSVCRPPVDTSGLAGVDAECLVTQKEFWKVPRKLSVACCCLVDIVGIASIESCWKDQVYRM